MASSSTVITIKEESPESRGSSVLLESVSSTPSVAEVDGGGGGGGRGTPRITLASIIKAGTAAAKGFDTKPDIHAIQSQMQMREAKPYKCTQCIKSFANSSYLSQHMRIHLGIKPFGPCQYCGKKFTQLSHLQQHIRTHTGEKPYKCKVPGCEKAFSQLSNLQSHSRCHQTDKPFKCNSCYKCFTEEAGLLEHIPKHKESKHLKATKVHICPFCGKSYTQATYLSKHMTKHSDRTTRMGYPVDTNSSAVVGSIDPLNPWNVPMPDDAMAAQQQAHQLAFSQFSNASMMSQGYPHLNNSAFTQLLNFQRNPRNGMSYLDYNGFAATTSASTKQDTGRPGFNMITPLESIQRYTATSAANGSSSVENSSTPSSAGVLGHLPFPPPPSLVIPPTAPQIMKQSGY